MKTISILLLFIFLSCSQNDLTTKEIREKASRIRTGLLNNKSLPAAIQKPTNQADVSSAPLGREYNFYYNTTRKENNLIDSIFMTVTVLTDSLEHLSFYEMHLKNDNEDKSYMYKVNKYGVIDWAYRTDPPASEPAVVKENGVGSYPISNQTIEINTDSANYDSKYNPIKKPDEKTLAVYTARLKASIEELEKMLFEK